MSAGVKCMTIPRLGGGVQDSRCAPIAESLQATLERQDYLGSKSIRGVAKSFSVVRGNEKAFLEQLQKATQDCESIGGSSLNKCAGIAATTAKAIKRTLGK